MWLHRGRVLCKAEGTHVMVSSALHIICLSPATRCVAADAFMYSGSYVYLCGNQKKIKKLTKHILLSSQRFRHNQSLKVNDWKCPKFELVDLSLV